MYKCMIYIHTWNLCGHPLSLAAGRASLLFSLFSNVVDNFRWTPLHHAAQAKQVESIKILLAAGADPNLQDLTLLTPAHLSSSEGDAASLTLLLKAGAHVEAQDWLVNMTPLHKAAAANQTSTIPILLRHGAKIEAMSRDNRTALHWAISTGSLEASKLLLEKVRTRTRKKA